MRGHSMQHFKFFSLICVFLFISCSTSSQIARYRPPGDRDALWNIEVQRKLLPLTFTLLVNDSQVVNLKWGFLSYSESGSGSYRGNLVSMEIERTPLTEQYNVQVFIANELAGRFRY